MGKNENYNEYNIANPSDIGMPTATGPTGGSSNEDVIIRVVNGVEDLRLNRIEEGELLLW